MEFKPPVLEILARVVATFTVLALSIEILLGSPNKLIVGMILFVSAIASIMYIIEVSKEIYTPEKEYPYIKSAALFSGLFLVISMLMAVHSGFTAPLTRIVMGGGYAMASFAFLIESVNCMKYYKNK